LKRLENATRYRPIHVQALFVGAASPADDRADLYSAAEKFSGEGAKLLQALDVEPEGRTVEATLSDFQRRGYLLTHILECPEVPADLGPRREAMRERLPAVLARIRRSFKAKRVVLLGEELAEFVPQFQAGNLESALILDDGKPFELDELDGRLLGELLAAPLQSM
jgi:hypothetical protein